MQTETILVRRSKSGGRGVFARKDLKKDAVIEVVPVLKVKISELPHIEQTRLKFYYYEYNDKYICFFLGYGSLYNHSYTPNARYLYNYTKRTATIKAIKPIKKGEEIFVNYNYYPNSKKPLEKWFDPDFKDKSIE